MLALSYVEGGEDGEELVVSLGVGDHLIQNSPHFLRACPLLAVGTSTSVFKMLIDA